MDHSLLSVDNLTVRHGSRERLKGVTLRVKEFEVIGVFGPNGSGKSTLLQTIMGLEKLKQGSISLGKKRIDRLSVVDRARLGIGYAPQGRRIFPGMTVDEHLKVSCRGPSIYCQTIANEMYSLFPPLANRRKSIAWQLSGGEQQMLSLARALMSKPKLLLVDEPTLGLSSQAIKQVLNKLNHIAELGTGVLLCEQIMKNVVNKCDRGYILNLGSIVTHGSSLHLTHNL